MVRKCANIKSRKYPDVRCNASAINGDFCARHYKNPHRYSNYKHTLTTINPLQEDAIKRIQRFYRRVAPTLLRRRQGPAANCVDIAENKTELQSMDTVKSIPKIYIWSYADAAKHIWVFDIRSFSHMIANGNGILKNPYTCQQIPQKARESLENRLSWLKSRNYMTSFVADTDLTAEQTFSLRVLDIFMKLDFLGYNSDMAWFMELDNIDQMNLYKELYELWKYRLELTTAMRAAICEDLDKLFKYDPLRSKQRVWKKINADIMEALVSRAPDKNNRSLGAMYILMALCKVSDGAAETYDWLS